MKLPDLQAAVDELGCGEAVWLRGHVAQHRLLPSLFRFPGGPEHEQLLIARSRLISGPDEARPDRSLAALVALHHRYVPTRLLAWTRSLHVALFCALIREQDQPAIFVLNPVALNALSGIHGVVRLPARFGAADAAARVHPIAIEATGATAPEIDLFTAHGRSSLPLEEQCPTCVRKVILTEAETALARQYVLSSDGCAGAR